jgi:hypothetical protein
VEASGEVAGQVAMVTAGGRHCSGTALVRDDDPWSALTRERCPTQLDGDSVSLACSTRDGEIALVGRLLMQARLLKWAASS